MRRPRSNQSGMTLIEVMLAVTFLAVSLVALLSMLTRGSVSVVAGGYWAVTVTLPRAAFVSELLITDPFVRISTRSDPGSSFFAKNVDTVVPFT